MIIALWILLRLIFIAIALFLIYYFIKEIRNDGALLTLIAGIKNALKDCGFYLRNRNYSIDLYRWVIDNEDEEICDESYERAQWPAMDIADWMKEGLPRNAQGETLCGRDCNCRLILERKKPARQAHQS